MARGRILNSRLFRARRSWPRREWPPTLTLARSTHLSSRAHHPTWPQMRHIHRLSPAPHTLHCDPWPPSGPGEIARKMREERIESRRELSQDRRIGNEIQLARRQTSDAAGQTEAPPQSGIMGGGWRAHLRAVSAHWAGRVPPLAEAGGVESVVAHGGDDTRDVLVEPLEADLEGRVRKRKRRVIKRSSGEVKSRKRSTD